MILGHHPKIYKPLCFKDLSFLLLILFLSTGLVHATTGSTTVLHPQPLYCFYCCFNAKLPRLERNLESFCQPPEWLGALACITSLTELHSVGNRSTSHSAAVFGLRVMDGRSIFRYLSSFRTCLLSLILPT